MARAFILLAVALVAVAVQSGNAATTLSSSQKTCETIFNAAVASASTRDAKCAARHVLSTCLQNLAPTLTNPQRQLGDILVDNPQVAIARKDPETPMVENDGGVDVSCLLITFRPSSWDCSFHQLVTLLIHITFFAMFLLVRAGLLRLCPCRLVARQAAHDGGPSARGPAHGPRLCVRPVL